jgi:hypothetical protein
MLSRVLFSEDNVDTDFWRFVKPWELTLDQVSLAFEGSSDHGEEDIRVSRMVNGIQCLQHIHSSTLYARLHLLRVFETRLA